MEKKNHEIRFACSQSEKNLINSLHKRIAPELKLSYFYNKIFLLGFDSLSKMLLKQNKKEILQELLR